MKNLFENWRGFLNEIVMPPEGFLEGSVYKETLYIGSDYVLKDEEQLDPSSGGEYGIYLSPSHRYARMYGKYLYRILANIKNPIYVEGKYEISPRDLTKEDAEKLKQEGYDSIVVTNSDIASATEVVVFDPKQLHIMEMKK